MLVHRVAVEKMGLAVCGPHLQAARRQIDAEQSALASRAAVRDLPYLVFDRNKLVAAFAWRDDAEQWIEEFGHSTMQVRQISQRRRAPKPNAGGR